MRIATNNAFESGISTLQRRQAAVAESQERLTSGKRVSKASDDPAAAARAERALASIGRAETAQRAVNASESVMRETEGAIADAVALLQQARETMVAAGNAAYSDAERRGLAEKLRAVRAQMLEVANRSDGAGTYLFGGQGAGAPPFADAAGGVLYTATPGELSTAGGMQLSADGRATFLTAPTGNGVFETRPGAGVSAAWIGAGHVVDPAQLTGDSYTLQFSVAAGVTTYAILQNGLPTAVTAAPYVDGQTITLDGMAFDIHGAPANGDNFDVLPSSNSASIFDTLDRAATELETSNRSGPERTQTTVLALRNLDSALGAMQTQRTSAGEALNRVDNESNRIDAADLRARTEKSNAEDLDMIEAVSTFQLRQTGYDAALKSYAMVQKLSLFDYLGR